MTYNVSEMAIKIQVAHSGHVARITVAQRDTVEIAKPVAQLVDVARHLLTEDS